MSTQDEVSDSKSQPQAPAARRSALFHRIMKNVAEGIKTSSPSAMPTISSTLGNRVAEYDSVITNTSTVPAAGASSSDAALVRKKKRRPEEEGIHPQPPSIHGFSKPLAELAAKFSRLKSPTKSSTKSPTRDVPAESAHPMQVDAVPDDEFPRGVRTLKFDDAVNNSDSTRQIVTMVPHATSKGGLVPIQAPTGLQLVASGQNNQMALVPYSQDGIYLGISKQTISKQKFDFIKSLQTSSQNMWNSAWAFPTGSVFERHALEACKSFLCLHIAGCGVGDCAAALGTHDIWEIRTRVAARLIKMKEHGIPGRDATLQKLLHGDLWPCWNGHQFSKTNIQISSFVHAELCPAAYALVIGATGGAAQAVLSSIRRGEAPQQLQGTGTSLVLSVSDVPEQTELERRSLDATLLQQYIELHLLKSEENNPAPGAARTVETVVNTKSWKAKFAACQEFIRKEQNVTRQIGSTTMFKKIWRKESRLKEKKAMSHSKCDLCKHIDVELERLKGVPGEDAARRRRFLLRSRQEHEKRHLSVRSVMDAHGFMAVVDPGNVWCIQCDAATARNMELPRINQREHRLPKKAAGTLPKFGLKLTATYCFGYGFIPFLSHDSLRHGPNLVWTVIWKSICRLYKHYGRYPDVLFILLDNTTGENKTNVMLAFASWLVATKRFKQVRVYFLMVGHTHVIIDQIFGVVTVYLRGREILLPEDLMKHIDNALLKCPQYEAKPVEWLHSLWNFWDWSDQMDIIKAAAEGIFKRPELTDEHGKYQGMSDFIFTHNKEQLALLQYREYFEFPLRPAGSPGIPIIRKLPTSVPKLVNVDPFSKWGTIGSKTIQNTVATFLSISTLDHTVTREKYVTDTWNQIIREIPTVIELLKSEHKIVFEHFDWNPSALLLGHTAGAGTEQQETEELTDEEAEYRVWCQTMFSGTRYVPFAFDPVVSREQTAGQYKKKREAYETALLGGTGPTTSTLSLVMSGRHIFARPQGQGVALYKIEDIGTMKTPRCVDPRLTCSRYSHVPAEGVDGFFGTFGPSKGVSKIVLTRSDVLVYNVELLPKTKIVALESLRVLALCLPLEYPVPRRVPASHLQTDGSDSDSACDEFDFELGPKEPKKAPANKGKARAQPKKKAATSGKGRKRAVPPRRAATSADAYAGKDSSDPSSSSPSPSITPDSSPAPSDEDEDAAAEPNPNGGKEAEEQESAATEAQRNGNSGAPVADQQSGHDVAAASGNPPASGSVGDSDEVPALEAPKDWCPSPESLAFVQREDDRENAIDLVWVDSLSESGDNVTLYWFGAIDLTDRLLLESPRIKFSKHWNTSDMVKLEIDLGLRTEAGTKKRRPVPPPKALVATYWSKDTYSTASGVFVPVLVPSPAPHKIWQCDATVTLHSEFLRGTLLPALRQLRDA